MDSAVTFIDSYAEELEFKAKICTSSEFHQESLQAEVKRCCNCECSVTGNSDAKLRSHILRCCSRELAVSLDAIEVKLCCNCERAVPGRDTTLRNHILACIRPNQSSRRFSNVQIPNAKPTFSSYCNNCNRTIGGWRGNFLNHLAACLRSTVRREEKPVPVSQKAGSKLAAQIEEAPPIIRVCCRCKRIIGGGSGHFMRHIAACDGSGRKDTRKRHSYVGGGESLFDPATAAFAAEIIAAPPCSHCGRQIAGGLGSLTLHARACGGVPTEKVKRFKPVFVKKYIIRVPKVVQQITSQEPPRTDMIGWRPVFDATMTAFAAEVTASPTVPRTRQCSRCGINIRGKLREHMRVCNEIGALEKKNLCARCGVEIGGGLGSMFQHLRKCDGTVNARRRELHRAKCLRQRLRRRLRRQAYGPLFRVAQVKKIRPMPVPKNKGARPASEWKVMCDHCGLFFAGAGCNLARHTALCEKTSAEGRVKFARKSTQITCRVCGCTFSGSGTYSRHLLVQRSACARLQKPQLTGRPSCGRCGRRLRDKEALQRHMISCLSVKSGELPNSTTNVESNNQGTVPAPTDVTQQFGERSGGASENGAILNPADGGVISLVALTKETENAPQGDEDFVGEPPIVAADAESLTDEAVHVYGCNLCDKTFPHSVALEIHAKYLHVATDDHPPFKCPTCAATFTNIGKVRLHWIKHTPSKFACPRCDLVFLREKTYRDHFEARHALRFHRCPDCPKKFAFKEDFVEHISRVHKKRPRIPCPNCHRSFDSKKHLQRHLRYHRFPKVECEICGKVMAAVIQTNFVSHMDRHFGYKRFKCKHCEMAFYSASNVLEHTRVHTGAKPFACNLCPKTFASRWNANQHKRMHLGIKPHICEFCGKGFTNPSNRKLHVRTQHVEPDCPRKKKKKPAVAAKERRIKRVGGAKKKAKRPKVEESDSESEIFYSSSEGQEELEEEEPNLGREMNSGVEWERDDSPELAPTAGIFQEPSTSSKDTETVEITVPSVVVAADGEIPTASSSDVVVEALNVANGLVDFWSHQLPLFHGTMAYICL